jgi:hypothetical protein
MFFPVRTGARGAAGGAGPGGSGFAALLRGPGLDQPRLRPGDKCAAGLQRNYKGNHSRCTLMMYRRHGSRSQESQISV